MCNDGFIWTICYCFRTNERILYLSLGIHFNFVNNLAFPVDERFHHIDEEKSAYSLVLTYSACVCVCSFAHNVKIWRQKWKWMSNNAVQRHIKVSVDYKVVYAFWSKKMLVWNSGLCAQTHAPPKFRTFGRMSKSEPVFNT